MKIIFFGDIVGRLGREAVIDILPKWKKKYQPDIILANGENSSHGKGVSKNSLEEMLAAGIDLVTTGNHIWRNKEAVDLLNDKEIPLLRPANYPLSTPGSGYYVLKLRTKKVLVINLIGRVSMHEQYDDPFRKADQIPINKIITTLQDAGYFASRTHFSPVGIRTSANINDLSSIF